MAAEEIDAALEEGRAGASLGLGVSSLAFIR